MNWWKRKPKWTAKAGEARSTTLLPLSLSLSLALSTTLNQTSSSTPPLLPSSSKFNQAIEAVQQTKIGLGEGVEGFMEGGDHKRGEDWLVNFGWKGMC